MHLQKNERELENQIHIIKIYSQDTEIYSQDTKYTGYTKYIVRIPESKKKKWFAEYESDSNTNLCQSIQNSQRKKRGRIEAVQTTVLLVQRDKNLNMLTNGTYINQNLSLKRKHTKFPGHKDTNKSSNPDRKRLHPMLINKNKRTCQRLDFPIPMNHRVKMNDREKISKYMVLVKELKKLWNMRVTVIPIVV